MGTLLIDEIDTDMLDQLIEQTNLRWAWRMRFSDFIHGHLTLVQHSHLQAECRRVFGSRWQEEIVKEGDYDV